ncbi:MAG: UvrD-helicase domain-containing protein, partial [Planctomycetales bacterium]
MAKKTQKTANPLEGLNPQQLEAVRTLAGPLLVLSGAGTGKTRVVTFRIANLIRNRVSPDRILAVTFTNKAAAEMKQRAAELIGRRRKLKPEISTFHSLCVRILRRHISNLGYPDKFAIYDRGDQESVARAALREIKAPTDSLRASDLLYLIGRWKNQSVAPQAAKREAETDREHLGAIAYARYQAGLEACGAVDFDDLLLLTERLFNDFKKVRRTEANRFDHVLIDEYQDTNGSQYRIVKALASGHRNLCVVGDDDQSIYGWRGAEVEHILRFKIDWPDATVVRLETNYRSRPHILEMANQLIQFNNNRHEKQLIPSRQRGNPPRIMQHEDETTEAREIAVELREILQKTSAQPRDFAILLRTNEQPRPVETELRRLQLPYVLVGGMSFYDRKEIRDLMAYFKVIVSGQDEPSLLRILNTPARGISNVARKRLIDAAIQQGQTPFELLTSGHEIEGISSRAADGMHEFSEMIGNYANAFSDSKDLVRTATALISEIDFYAELQRRHPDPLERESRVNAVEQLINALGSYQQGSRMPTLQGFLDDTLLSDRSDTDKDSQINKNAIMLM